MLDESTDAMSVSEEPESDVLHRYEQQLLLDEQLAELRQQVEGRDQEIDELRHQLDRTTAEHSGVSFHLRLSVCLIFRTMSQKPMQ